MELDAFNRLLDETSLLYNNIDEVRYDAWKSAMWRSFGDYPEEVFASALCRHQEDPAEGRFRPLPAHVSGHVTAIMNERCEPIWNALVRSMSRYGAYRSVDFGDPKLHYAIKSLGGWPKLCRMEPKELERAREAFPKLLLEASNAPVESLPARVIGEFEMEGSPALVQCDIKKAIGAQRRVALSA